MYRVNFRVLNVVVEYYYNKTTSAGFNNDNCDSRFSRDRSLTESSRFVFVIYQLFLGTPSTSAKCAPAIVTRLVCGTRIAGRTKEVIVLQSY